MAHLRGVRRGGHTPRRAWGVCALRPACWPSQLPLQTGAGRQHCAFHGGELGRVMLGPGGSSSAGKGHYGVGMANFWLSAAPCVAPFFALLLPGLSTAMVPSSSISRPGWHADPGAHAPPSCALYMSRLQFHPIPWFCIHSDQKKRIFLEKVFTYFSPMFFFFFYVLGTIQI